MAKSEGHCNFEWVSNEPISDDLEDKFDSDYPIADILNKIDTFEELNEENNNNSLDDEENVQEIKEPVINNEECSGEIIDGRIPSDNEMHNGENYELEE